LKKLLPLLFLFSSLPVFAGKPVSGLTSNDFDGSLSGARFIGWGEAGAALPGGPESPVWNPAALHDLKSTAVSIDFDVARQSRLAENVLLGASSLRGRKLTYVGFAAPDAAFFYRPLASFNQRTVTNPLDPANNFKDDNLSVNQFGISAASEGDKGAVMGINLSYLTAHRGLAEAATGKPPVASLADGNGFTLDLGLRQNFTYGSVGVAGFNLPGILYWNAYHPDTLPITVRAGGVFYPVKFFGITTEYDKIFYRGGLPRPHNLHLGMEMTLFSMLQVRGGTYGENLNDRNKTSYTGGFSAFSANGYQVDFALRSYRYLDERVYNYFLSLVLPFQGEHTETSRRAPR
jgi:hypothetical protein